MNSIVNAEEHGKVQASHKFRFSDQLISYIPGRFGYVHTPAKWSEANDSLSAKPEFYRSSRSPFPPPICG